MTGRGRGFCAGFDVPGYMNSDFRRGFGRRFNRGFYPQAIQPQTIINSNEKEMLEIQLKEIQKRLKELKSK